MKPELETESREHKKNLNFRHLSKLAELSSPFETMRQTMVIPKNISIPELRLRVINHKYPSMTSAICIDKTGENSRMTRLHNMQIYVARLGCVPTEPFEIFAYKMVYMGLPSNQILAKLDIYYKVQK